MGYAHALKRVTFSGTSFNGAEIWSTGLFVGSSSADCSNPTQAFADACRTAWTAFFQNADSHIGNSWKTDNVKVAQIGTDGKTSLSNVVYAPYGTAIAGIDGGPVYPPQIALVASLENAGARGLAAKGRMYLPGIASGLGGDGRITTSHSLGIANAMKALIDQINDACPPGEEVILASQGRRTKGPDGKYTPVPGTAVTAAVNRVRVGSVLDTQRRRRNQLVEVYQTATIA